MAGVLSLPGVYNEVKETIKYIIFTSSFKPENSKEHMQMQCQMGSKGCSCFVHNWSEDMFQRQFPFFLGAALAVDDFAGKIMKPSAAA